MDTAIRMKADEIMGNLISITEHTNEPKPFLVLLCNPIAELPVCTATFATREEAERCREQWIDEYAYLIALGIEIGREEKADGH